MAGRTTWVSRRRIPYGRKPLRCNRNRRGYRMEIQQLEFLKHVFHFKRQVYLDHNATTPVSRRVRRKMNQALEFHYGNASSFYGAGRKSAELIEQARRQVADAIHADANEVFFTSCATESNNAVLKAVRAHFYPKKMKIVSTPIEHHS